jgi:hypothetical protein
MNVVSAAPLLPRSSFSTWTMSSWPSLQQVADVHPAARRLLLEVLLRDFLQRQEAVALAAVLDERRLEARLDARDASLVDVGLLLFLGRNLDRQVVELLTVNECDAQLLLLRRVDQHSLHWPLLGSRPGGRMGPTSWRFATRRSSSRSARRTMRGERRSAIRWR